MSSDNYLVADHDGKSFLVGMGFASSDEGPINWEPFNTEEEVLKEIENTFPLEYGVSWTEKARAACGINFYKEQIRAAYRAGQESMRERAAKESEREDIQYGKYPQDAAEYIRALPIEEPEGGA